LRHLTLSNIAFFFPSSLPSPEAENSLAATSKPTQSLIPTGLPQLCTIYISQATLLPASAVAATLALQHPGMDSLQRVRLVDAYEGSIWGRRLRRSDVESAAARLAAESDTATLAAIERVRAIVVCEAKTERIMGGDRVEGMTLLY
jgi:hypothetical protein